MRAGSLNRRVEVQKRTLVTGETGENVETWVKDRCLWMGKRDVRASEKFTGAELQAEVDTVFTARHLPAGCEIRPDTHRFVYADRIYQIHGMAELGYAAGVEFACTARTERAHG